ncbi:MAG: hypothetical protein WAV89_06170 [Ignavibacteriaceae bacterium]
MKTSTIILTFLIIATVYAGAYVSYFHARSEADNVRLEWQTGDESNLQKFVIERKTPQSSFIEIQEVTPKGDNSYYTYLDENTYKANDLVFVYRLKMVDTDGTVTYLDQSTSVSLSISGVKRTWGSIKAMFR